MPGPNRNYSSPDDAIAIDLNAPGGYALPDGSVAAAPPPVASMASTPSLQIRGTANAVPRNVTQSFWNEMSSPPRVLGDGSMRFNIGQAEYTIPAAERSQQQLVANLAARRFGTPQPAEGLQSQAQAAAPADPAASAGAAAPAAPGVDLSALMQAPPPVRIGVRANPGATAASSLVDFASQRANAAGQPQELPNPYETLAEQAQRVQGARDAGNAEVNQQAQANLAQAQAQEEARQADLQRRARLIDEEIDRVSNMRIDPNNWYASRGTIGAIGAALAVGMGAAAQSLTGGQNNALGIINAAIDRDIQAQEANLRAAGQRVGERQNALQQLRAQYGDERTAREAFRMQALQQAERMAAQRVERASTPSAKEMEAAQLAEIQGQRVLAEDRFRQQLQLQANEQEFEARKAQAALAARRTGGGGGRRPQQDNLQFRLAADRAIADINPNISPEARSAMLNNVMTLYQRNELGQSPEGMEILRRMQSNESAGPQGVRTPEQIAAQRERERTEMESRTNASLASGNSGLGIISSIPRMMSPGIAQTVVREALEGVGVNTSLSPEVAAEIASYQTALRAQMGVARSAGERESFRGILDSLNTQGMSDDVARAALRNARIAVRELERGATLENEAELAQRAAAQQSSRQSVLSSGRGRR